MREPVLLPLPIPVQVEDPFEFRDVYQNIEDEKNPSGFSESLLLLLLPFV